MLYGILTMFFGATGIYLYARASSTIRTAKDWPTVPGKILERGVGAQMPGMSRGVVMPLVRYTYVVGDKTYTNDQVYSIRLTGNLADVIKKLVEALPDPVPVHYDPKHPEDSYLVLNPMRAAWVALVFGILASLVGVILVLTGLLNRK